MLVSACLLGEACRYDGRSQRSESVLAALEGKAVIPICPEAAAGLGIPRPPVDLAGGTGVDVWAGRARASRGRRARTAPPRSRRAPGWPWTPRGGSTSRWRC
ncbi:2-thiouracil desulfurase family protein [Corallococcus sp. 4LFB]|uniref:2-thiouracil desulfurase family protein n=1 Tax=Corallococcus sp. 4LFB TaxID=3383249 RepID=UPI0039763767